MTIRNYSAKNIPARWFSRPRVGLLVAGCLCFTAVQNTVAAPAKPPAKRAATRPAARPQAPRPVTRTIPQTGDLAALVQAWREAPSPDRRSRVEAFAVAHGREDAAMLARLALGIGDYEQKDYSSAVASLRAVQPRLPQLADYTSYYLGVARVEARDVDGVVKELIPAHAGEVRSPLAARAWVVEARALQGSDAPASIRVLRDHYQDLPQPDGDLTLAQSYEAAKQLPQAAEYYQRVFYEYLAGEAANRAAAALISLKEAMGAAYPQPSAERLLHRADRLLEAREYLRARSEYQDLADSTAVSVRDRARIRMGAVDYLSGKTNAAQSYLRALQVSDSEAAAERNYYLAECARRLGDDSEMMAALQRLATGNRKSPYRMKALLSAGNRYLLVNRPDDYIPLFRAVYEDFPGEAPAALAHWKVTFQAYLHDKGEAADLLREHLRNYPAHSTAGAALYFFGRHQEEHGDAGSARACYQKLSQTFQNHYYAMLARERMTRLSTGTATAAPDTSRFLAALTLTEGHPVPPEGNRATALHIERARLLRAAGLNDLADAELRFGSRTDGQPALLGMEIAYAAEAPHRALRIMKGMAPDYLSLTLTQAPRKFWELLFPLPYRDDLVVSARQRELDPFLVAGLIRQESEFNPEARSSANAYGLTQVRPGTGRQFARRAGVTPFSNRVLFQPAANLKIGTSILRSMLDQNSGKVEQTLASYNAGPNRVSEWMTWNKYREPAEFVESIPFTETRDYVQAVLRNADIYRRLYQ